MERRRHRRKIILLSLPSCYSNANVIDLIFNCSNILLWLNISIWFQALFNILTQYSFQTILFSLYRSQKCNIKRIITINITLVYIIIRI